MSAHVQNNSGPVNQADTGNPFSQITMSRTAIALIPLLENFALLLLLLALQTEQAMDSSKLAGQTANAKAKAMQQKGHDQAMGQIWQAATTIFGAGLSIAAFAVPNPGENTNDDEITSLSNQRSQLEELKNEINTRSGIQGGGIADNNQNRPQINEDWITELKGGKFLVENKVTETRYQPLRLFGSKKGFGSQTVDNPEQRMLYQSRDPIFDDQEGPLPGVSIKSAMEAIEARSPEDAEEIKTALNKEIDKRTMDINSKAQKLSTYNSYRQTFSGLVRDATTGTGNIKGAGYQQKAGTDDLVTEVNSAVNSQMSSVVGTNTQSVDRLTSEAQSVLQNAQAISGSATASQ